MPTTKKKKLKHFKVGDRVMFITGDIPRLRKGGSDWRRPGTVIVRDGEYAPRFPYEVRMDTGGYWLARRSWLRKWEG